MKFTVEIMTTWEAIRPFITDEELKKEWSDERAYKDIDLSDDATIQFFLDETVSRKSEGIRRMTEEECKFFNLNWQDGYYISDWNNEYIKDISM